MGTELTVIDGETMCVCGHIRDEHGEKWCLKLGLYGVDDCIEFRPAPGAQAAQAQEETK